MNIDGKVNLGFSKGKRIKKIAESGLEPAQKLASEGFADLLR